MAGTSLIAQWHRTAVLFIRHGSTKSAGERSYRHLFTACKTCQHRRPIWCRLQVQAHRYRPFSFQILTRRDSGVRFTAHAGSSARAPPRGSSTSHAIARPSSNSPPTGVGKGGSVPLGYASPITPSCCWCAAFTFGRSFWSAAGGIEACKRHGTGQHRQPGGPGPARTVNGTTRTATHNSWLDGGSKAMLFYTARQCVRSGPGTGRTRCPGVEPLESDC
jgi:hypothetical protein